MKFDQDEFYIRIENFVSVSNYSGKERPVLTTKGCSCCTKDFDLTKGTLTQAIGDAARFLNALVKLDRDIDWEKVDKQILEYHKGE